MMLELHAPERFDTLNATETEERFQKTIATEHPTDVVIDFSRTTYISSAGLRVVLAISKKLRADGTSLLLRDMQEEVYTIFKMAGFDTILNIEH